MRGLNLFVFFFILLTPLISLGQIKPDYFSLPKVVAIEERKFDQKFEVAFGFSYFPSNAFNRYFSGSLAGYYKFSPNWSWEIFRFDAMREEETDLKTRLEEDLAIEVRNQNFGGRFLPMKSIIRSGLVWEPFYNKGLFANSKLVHSNLSVLLNGGAVFYKGRSNQAMVSLGAIYNFFFSSSYCLKLDFRQSFVFDADQGLTDFTELGLGIGYRFGGGVL